MEGRRGWPGVFSTAGADGHGLGPCGPGPRGLSRRGRTRSTAGRRKRRAGPASVRPGTSTTSPPGRVGGGGGRRGRFTGRRGSRIRCRGGRRVRASAATGRGGWGGRGAGRDRGGSPAESCSSARGRAPRRGTVGPVPRPSAQADATRPWSEPREAAA